MRRLRAFSFPGELHYPFFRGLGRALKAESPELVHVHTYGTNQVAVTRRFARRAHVPWVLTAHYHPIWSIWGGSLRHRLRRYYDARLAAPLVREASCLIVQSREEERLLKENGFPLPRVALIPPGYSPMRAPDPVPPLPRPSESPDRSCSSSADWPRTRDSFRSSRASGRSANMIRPRRSC